MYSSNQVFSISGHDKKELSRAIKYALDYGECCGKEYFPVCFKIDPVFGVVFYWIKQEGAETIPVYLQTVDCLCDLIINALKEEVFKSTYSTLLALSTIPDGTCYNGWLLYCCKTDEIENNYGFCTNPQDLRYLHNEHWNGDCNWHYSSFAVKPYIVYFSK